MWLVSFLRTRFPNSHMTGSLLFFTYKQRVGGTASVKFRERKRHKTWKYLIIHPDLTSAKILRPSLYRRVRAFIWKCLPHTSGFSVFDGRCYLQFKMCVLLFEKLSLYMNNCNCKWMGILNNTGVWLKEILVHHRMECPITIKAEKKKWFRVDMKILVWFLIYSFSM